MNPYEYMNRYEYLHQVSFPGFSIDPFKVDPVAFTLPFGDGLEIMWYALIITAGFITAFLYAWFRAKRNEGYVVDDLFDIMIYLILFGVLGARLYYVIMSPSEFDSLKDILNIRSGGLAIYGGLIGGVLAILGVCLVKKMNLWRVLDMAAPGVMIAQAIGRWGNFMNIEAYGTSTTLPWRMCSPKIAEEMLRDGYVTSEGYKAILMGELGAHPTFLYESLWNVLGFVLLNLVYRKKRYNGQILLLYLVWYGFGRMWIEGLRTDSLMLGPFRVSQLLSFLVFAVGLALLIVFWVKGKKGEVKNLCSFCTLDKKSSHEKLAAVAATEATSEAALSEEAPEVEETDASEPPQVTEQPTTESTESTESTEKGEQNDGE